MLFEINSLPGYAVLSFDLIHDVSSLFDGAAADLMLLRLVV